MIELLTFVLTGPWTFLGCMSLAVLIVAGAILVTAALANCRPLQGIVQVHNPTISETVVDDHHSTHRSTAVQPTARTEVRVKQDAEADAGLDASDTDSQSVEQHAPA